MSDPDILRQFRVVLWRPKSPGNVGSVARAMKNMGFLTLRIADPMRYDDPRFFMQEAARLAWDAADVLVGREEYATLHAAVSDATTLVGITGRAPAERHRDAPRDVAPRLLEAAARGPVALLFGQEDIGLTQDALARCPILATIPTSGSYGSLNLAQAALLVLYEIRLAAVERGGVAAGASSPNRHSLPTQAEIDDCFCRLSSALDAIGFFTGSGRLSTERALRETLAGALATRRGLALLEGIAHRIRLAGRRSDR